MAPSTVFTFACPACAKRMKWREEIIGKRARCKCGQISVVPRSPVEIDSTRSGGHDDGMPAGPGQQLRQESMSEGLPDDPYAIAPEPTHQVEDETVAAAKPVIHITNQALKDKLASLPRTRIAPLLDENPDDEKAMEDSLVRDVIVPVGLIVIGLGLCFYEAMYASSKPVNSMAAALPSVVVRLGLAIGLMLGGMFVATQFFDVYFFGTFKKSILRIIGIAVGPAAIYGILSYQIEDVGGSALGSIVAVAVYATLFRWLLRTSAASTAVCTIVTWALITFANYMAFKAQGMKSDSWL